MFARHMSLHFLSIISALTLGNRTVVGTSLQIVYEIFCTNDYFVFDSLADPSFTRRPKRWWWWQRAEEDGDEKMTPWVTRLWPDTSIIVTLSRTGVTWCEKLGHYTCNIIQLSQCQRWIMVTSPLHIPHNWDLMCSTNWSSLLPSSTFIYNCSLMMDIVSWPDWARCSLTFVQDFNLCAFVCVCRQSM